MESELLTAWTRIDVHIAFADAGRAGRLPQMPSLSPVLRQVRSNSAAWDCKSIKVTSGMPAASAQRLGSFISKLENDAQAVATVPYELATMSLAYQRMYDDRCAMLNNGSLPALRSNNATRASLVQLLSTATSLFENVGNVLSHAGERSTSSTIKRVTEAWKATSRH